MALQGRVCRPLFVVENNRLRIRKKHINDLHDPNYGWTNLMQQVGARASRPSVLAFVSSGRDGDWRLSKLHPYYYRPSVLETSGSRYALYRN